MNEKYVDGCVGAMVRMMVKGGCLPVRGVQGCFLRYDEERCVCGYVESEEHVLFTCNIYMVVRIWMPSMLMCMMLYKVMR